MKFTHYSLLIAALCSISLFSMENNWAILSVKHALTFHNICKKESSLEKAVPKIKALTVNNREWEAILGNKECTSQLLDFVDGHPKIINAALLGTPGAIAFGREYTKWDHYAQKSLAALLVTVADLDVKNLVWPKQDIEIATNILNMTAAHNLTDMSHCFKALTSATAHGKKDFVKLLLDKDVNIDSRDGFHSRTALMVAANYGYNDILDMLIERGANVNASNINETALSLAVSRGHVEAVEKLIAANANVNALDGDGKNILQRVQDMRSKIYTKDADKIIQLLIDAGAQ